MNIQQTLMCSTCTSCKETINKNQEGQIDCIRIDNQEILDNIANDGKYHSLREDTRVERSCERCYKNDVTYIDKFELQTSSATVVIDCQRATITPIANAPTYLKFQALKVPETIKLQSVTYYLTAALMKTGATDAEGHYFLRIKVNDELTAIVNNGSIPKKVLCYPRSCNCWKFSVRREGKVSEPCGNLFCR